jgi:hypothetical protein
MCVMRWLVIEGGVSSAILRFYQKRVSALEQTNDHHPGREPLPGVRRLTSSPARPIRPAPTSSAHTVHAFIYHHRRSGGQADRQTGGQIDGQTDRKSVGGVTIYLHLLPRNSRTRKGQDARKSCRLPCARAALHCHRTAPVRGAYIGADRCVRIGRVVLDHVPDYCVHPSSHNPPVPLKHSV